MYPQDQYPFQEVIHVHITFDLTVQSFQRIIRLDSGPVLCRKVHEVCKLDVIKCFTKSGKASIQGEVLKKLKQLYLDLGVEPLPATPEVTQ